jgi:Uma2 family endonuclease
MFAVVSPEKIHLPPGTVIRMEGTWQDYQVLLDRLGDRVLPRIKYRPGELLLMSPMPKHGFDAAMLADIAKVLLDHLGQEYLSYTPITMDLPEVAGIEPDYCFYTDHHAAVIGKARINWQIDPPPDLVIEIDVTSYTQIDDYRPYKVPEVWLFKRDRLLIYQLQNGDYQLTPNSRCFPGFDLESITQNCLTTARTQPSSIAIKALRKQYPIA